MVQVCFVKRFGPTQWPRQSHKSGLYSRSVFSKRRQRGQSAAEIALIVALVAVGAIAILTVMGTTVSMVFSNVVCDVQGADPQVFPSSPCAHFTPSPSPSSSLPLTGGNH